MGFLDKLLGSKRNVAIIDMGASAFKIAVAEKGKVGFKLTYLSLVPYPLKVASVRDLVEAKEFGKELKLVLDLIPGKIKEIGLVLPGYFTILKIFTFEAEKVVDNVEETIEEALEAEFPFDLSELVYDYWIYPREEGMVDVLCAVVQKEVIDKCTHVFSQAGRELVHVDTPFTALANLYFYNYGYPDEPVAVVDIGKIDVDIVIFKEARILFAKSLPDLGGDLINQKIAEALSAEGIPTDVDDIERQKVSGMLPDNVLLKGVLGFSETFKREVGTIFDDMNVKKLFITGGVSTTPYLKKMLSEKLDIETQLLSPLDNVELEKDIDRIYVEEISERLAVALGGIINLVM